LVCSVLERSDKGDKVDFMPRDRVGWFAVAGTLSAASGAKPG